MKRKFLSSIVALALFPIASSASAITAEQAAKDLKLTELAQTYTTKQVLTVTGSNEATKSDALFVDMGVLSVKDLRNRELVSSKLSTFVKDQLDLSENYVGNVSDKNIVERINKEWADSKVIDDEETLSLLNSFIDKGYTTGYNVVDVTKQSNFDDELMIRYGHNDINHANQLIYLMKSKGFDPKVQFIPKSSAFLYLPEWGESSYPVMTMDSGKMIAVVKEYNLDFEFQTPENKQRFMDLITQYAKKDAADEKGLLIESWWQPFYRSYTEMPGYKVLAENRVMIGDYQADLLSLPEKAEKQEKQVKAAAKSYDVVPTKVWVNPSFYRYMNGEFK
ncbi:MULTISPECIES: hypothetical protein [Vibrio]|uniref:hypothetical protein n=1 Tax=Vibrio TaxID=662 RepID=UPI0004DCFDB1|nr:MULTISPECIES: hypothetical protein [Vibrio]KFA99308.1 hypothetical protein HW45_04525 [Vibrio sp. ER1A]MCG9659966.1 hypothetical protein [Vibrio mediterranei]